MAKATTKKTAKAVNEETVIIDSATTSVDAFLAETPATEEEAMNQAIVAGIEEVKNDMPEQPEAEPVVNEEVAQVEKVIEEATTEMEQTIANLETDIMTNPDAVQQIVEDTQKKLTNIKNKIATERSRFTSFWNGINTGW